MRHVTGIPWQPAAAAGGVLPSPSPNVGLPGHVPPSHIRPNGLPIPPLTALRSAVEPAPNVIPFPPYTNPCPDARFTVPCTFAINQESCTYVGFQSALHADFRPQHHDLRHPHQLQQLMSSQDQLMMLFVQHHQAANCSIQKLECALGAAVADLSRAAVVLTAPSSLSAQRLLGAVKLMSGEVDSVKLQHRITYNLLAAQINVGGGGQAAPSRVNPHWVRDNLRLFLQYLQCFDAVAFKLRRALMPLTSRETVNGGAMAEAAALWQINEFWRLLSLFQKAVETFLRTLASTAGRCPPSDFVSCTSNMRRMPEANEYRQTETSTDDVTGLRKAFDDEIDRLILTEQDERQRMTSTTSSCQVVAVSTLSMVDRLSAITKPLDSNASRSTTMDSPAAFLNAIVQQNDLPDANAETAVNQPPEMKSSNADRSRHTDLRYVVVGGDDDADFQPPCIGNDSANWCSQDVVDIDTRVISAVELSSFGGFSLFVPFSTAPGDHGTSVESARLLSDGGVVVKPALSTSITDPLPPSNDVVSGQMAKDADLSLLDVDRSKADDVAVDTNLAFRGDTIFCVLPDAGISVFPSVPELLPPTFSHEQAQKKVSATDKQAFSDAAPLTESSTTTQFYSKVVDTGVNVPPDSFQHAEISVLPFVPEPLPPPKFRHKQTENKVPESDKQASSEAAFPTTLKSSTTTRLSANFVDSAVLSVPSPNCFQDAGISVHPSAPEAPPRTFGHKQTEMKVLGSDKQARSQNFGGASTTVKSSTTTRFSSKVVDSSVIVPPDCFQDTGICRQPSTSEPPTFGHKDAEKKMLVSDKQTSTESRGGASTTVKSSATRFSSKTVDAPVQCERRQQQPSQKFSTSVTSGADEQRRQNSGESGMAAVKWKPTSHTTDHKYSCTIQKTAASVRFVGLPAKRRGRPPKQRIDKVVMPTPAQLKCQPEARRKILDLYQRSQFTLLDGSKRTNSAFCRLPATSSEEPPASRDPGPVGVKQRISHYVTAGLTKTTAASVSVESTKSRPATAGALKIPITKLSTQTPRPTSKQQMVKSRVAAKSTATARTNTRGDVAVPAKDRCGSSEPAASAKASLAADTLPSESDAHRSVGGNSSTALHAQIKLAANTDHSSYCCKVPEAVTNVEDGEDDEDPDRLIIDLDHADPYNDSFSNCHSDRIGTSTVKDGRRFGDESNENLSTSVMPTGPLNSASATITPSSSDCRPKTTSGNHSTTSGPSPAKTSTVIVIII